MKKLLPIIFCFISIFHLTGQSNSEELKERFHHGYGIEIDYSVYPYHIEEPNAYGFNYWNNIGPHLTYFFEFDIAKFNPNRIFSISIHPALGLGYHWNGSQTTGIGSLNFSTALNYKEPIHGLSLSISREARRLPLILLKENPNSPYIKKDTFKGMGGKIGFPISKKRQINGYIKAIYFFYSSLKLNGNVELEYNQWTTFLVGTSFNL